MSSLTPSQKPGDIPPAKVVHEGKLSGDVPRGATSGGTGARHKRRISNFLLDKTLQLRYIAVVTVVSAIISGVLGYLIYMQEQQASAGVTNGLATFNDPELQRSIGNSMAAGDSKLLLIMVGVGIGLVVVLSLFLLVMTHKVAGPLYKISVHLDAMADGKLHQIGGPRRGDMLQDFHASFREMHVATRERVSADVTVMQELADSCASTGLDVSPSGKAALAQLTALIEQRRSALG